MDFDNEYRLRAFVDYGLDSDQVRDANCFAGIWIGVKALEYIKLAYDKGLDDVDKRAKAQDAFNQIKDFESKESIEAFQLFVEYGLNPDQIRDAKCFRFWMSGDKALKSFRQAHDSGTDVDNKAARVQEIFDKIKDFDLVYHITAVVDYGLDRDQIEAAKCFGWNPVEKAAAYIKQAYDSGTDLNNKIAEAQAAFYKIKDFDTRYRIQALLDYGLNYDQVKAAECFGGGAGYNAIEYIKQAHDSGADIDDKIAKTQEAFNRIKDLDSTYRIQAVLNYSLNYDQVKAAKCFDWAAEYAAMSYINRFYTSGTDLDDKITKAQSAFNQIKDFDSAHRIEAIVDYGLNPEQVRDAKCLDWGIGHRVMEYIKQAYNSGSNLDDKLVKAQRAFTQINDKDANCSTDNMICIITKEAVKDSCTVAEIIALVNHVSKLDDEYMNHHMDHNFVKLISLLDEYMSIDSDAVGVFMSRHIYPYHTQAFIAHINDYHVQHSSFKMGALVTDLVEHSHV